MVYGCAFFILGAGLCFYKAWQLRPFEPVRFLAVEEIGEAGAKGTRIAGFRTGRSWVLCDAKRCSYDGFQHDLGRPARIGLDRNGDVSEIVVDGQPRLTTPMIAAQFHQLQIIALAMLAIGMSMLAAAFVMRRKQKMSAPAD